jgi:hypothetical protein
VKTAGVLLAAAVVFLTATVASEWKGPAGPPHPIAVQTTPPPTGPNVVPPQPPTNTPNPGTRPGGQTPPPTVTVVRPPQSPLTPIGPIFTPPGSGPPPIVTPPVPPPAPAPGPSELPNGHGKGVKNPHGHHGSCHPVPQGPDPSPYGQSDEQHGKAGEHGNHYGLDKHDDRETPPGLAKRHGPGC